MALNIKPIADRVVIEPSAAETTTASGIIIPDTAKEKPQKGTVVAVGTGKTDYTMTVKIGDTVLYGSAYVESMPVKSGDQTIATVDFKLKGTGTLTSLIAQ
jgi:chaperonin GroES